jgi:hypothetical protein
MTQRIGPQVGISGGGKMVADRFDQRIAIFAFHGFDYPSMVTLNLL